MSIGKQKYENWENTICFFHRISSNITIPLEILEIRDLLHRYINFMSDEKEKEDILFEVQCQDKKIQTQSVPNKTSLSAIILEKFHKYLSREQDNRQIWNQIQVDNDNSMSDCITDEQIDFFLQNSSLKQIGTKMMELAEIFCHLMNIFNYNMCESIKLEKTKRMIPSLSQIMPLIVICLKCFIFKFQQILQVLQIREKQMRDVDIESTKMTDLYDEDESKVEETFKMLEMILKIMMFLYTKNKQLSRFDPESLYNMIPTKVTESNAEIETCMKRLIQKMKEHARINEIWKQIKNLNEKINQE